MEVDAIVCGDCLDVMKEMPDGCVDLVLTDPPYKDGPSDGAWDSSISLVSMWNCFYRISKINAVFAFFGQPPFTFRIGSSNIEHFRHEWTWVKDKAANYLAAPYMPQDIIERILIFSRCGFAHNSHNKCTYNPEMKKGKKLHPSMRSPSQTERFLRPKRKSWRARENQYYLNPEQRYPKNVLYYPVPWGEDRVHPTQKPVGLMEYLIKTYSNPGDLIFDPFIGSGTTAVAALKLGRHFYGCDINQEYVDIANERIEKAKLEVSQMELGI